MEHSKCIFCLHGDVTGKTLEAKMPAETGKHQREASRGWMVGERANSRTQKAEHERATQQQIDRAPTGTLAHRNYLCPALHGERQQRAPSRMLKNATTQAQGNLAYERGLLPSIAHIVPPRQLEPHFVGP